jgi:hypothetical protein
VDDPLPKHPKIQISDRDVQDHELSDISIVLGFFPDEKTPRDQSDHSAPHRKQYVVGKGYLPDCQCTNPEGQAQVVAMDFTDLFFPLRVRFTVSS